MEIKIKKIQYKIITMKIKQNKKLQFNNKKSINKNQKMQINKIRLNKNYRKYIYVGYLNEN
jgi:hypothetical protein|tara:strand:- start:1156 stop:1338 length:183 start_codon:yes stop_codon:yes gene_type:complete